MPKPRQSASCGRNVIRVLVPLVFAGWLVSASAVPPRAAPRCVPVPSDVTLAPHNGTWCALISQLGVDLLWDGVGWPTQPQVGFSEISPEHAAAFRTYALTDTLGLYANVTHERRYTRISVRAPRDGGDVTGRIVYSATAQRPTYYYLPRFSARQDRIAFIDFAYRCLEPNRVYRRRVMLTLRGADRAPDQAASGTPPELLTNELPEPTASAGLTRRQAASSTPGSGFAVSVNAQVAEMVQDGTATFLVTITNHGIKRTTAPGVVVRWPWTLTMGTIKPSQGSAGWGGRNTATAFHPGDLDPGASATLTLTGRAPFTGISTVSVVPLASDPDQSDDAASVTVARPPRPDLVADWLAAQIAPPEGVHRRQLLTGVLQVRNNGDSDAGPTRLVLFLSADDEAGPEDQLVGFADVPALAAGASTDVELEYRLRSRPQHRRTLLAITDSSNSEREIDEENNAANAPLRP